MLRTALAPDNLAASAEHGAPIAAAVESLLQCIAAEPNRVPQATAQGRSVYQGYPTDESDICEGGSLVPPPTSQGARVVRAKFTLSTLISNKETGAEGILWRRAGRSKG